MVSKNSSNSLKTLGQINDDNFQRRSSGSHRQLDVSSLEKDNALSISSLTTASTEQRNIKNPTTDCETLLHIFKANIGSGYLALPSAVLNSGLWIGLIGMAILGSLCNHCMHLILKSSQELCQRTGKASLNYEETVEMSFRCGPQSLRKWSQTFFNIITIFLVLAQLGFCCVYFVFISQNMYQAAECISGGTDLTPFNYMAITLIPMLLICYIPDLKYLAPVSMIANLFQLVGLIIIFYYLVRDLPEIGPDVRPYAPLSNFPLFFGTALYAFEGIGLVLPLENNMKRPSHLPGWTGVLNTGMVVTICLYTAVGFFGYLAYGENVLGSITLNLPGNEILAQSVKILMSLAIFLSYPLQFYVPLSILLPYLIRGIKSRHSKFAVEYAFRSFLVCVTFGLAATIPNVALFTNIVGAICCSTLSLIVPPLVDIVTFWPHKGRQLLRLFKNCFIIFVGILGFITGTFMSIKEIIAFFQVGDTTIQTGC